MAERTGIEWAHSTWNPWMGCKKVSPGCAKCYMFRDMEFYGRDPHTVTRAASPTFRNPLKWAKSAKLASGSRIFTCSWSDWFIDKADNWREEAWRIIWETPQFNYLILTKRPERIDDCLPSNWGNGYPNVWLGVSAENQKYADERIPILLSVPSIVHFISAEPLLGEINALKYQESLPQKYSDGLKQEQLYTQGRIDFLRQMLADSIHIKQPELKKP
jgi:protein gp37